MKRLSVRTRVRIVYHEVVHRFSLCTQSCQKNKKNKPEQAPTSRRPSNVGYLVYTLAFLSTMPVNVMKEDGDFGLSWGFRSENEAS